MSNQPYLDVQGLTVKFGGLTAINGLSMQVERGRIHALIGPNGAGKSTTFNCISRSVSYTHLTLPTTPYV